MERDWFDYVSLIFNMLATSAGLIGLFIAVRAYKVARLQHRLNYEIGVLKELHEIINYPDFVDDLRLHITSDSSLAGMSIHFSHPGINSNVYRLRRAAHELPTWMYCAFSTSPLAPGWLTMMTEVSQEVSASRVHRELQAELENAIYARLS